MSVIFDDNFSGYTPGQDPFGSWVEEAVLTGHVVNFGTMTGSTPAPGFYERLGQGYQMGVNGQIALQAPAGTPAPAVTCVWAGFGNAAMFVGNIDVLNPNSAINICWMSFESDGSVSIRAHSTFGGHPIVGGALAGNSPTQRSFDHTWHYYQLNVITTSVDLGTDGTFVGFDAEAYVDGDIACSTAGWVTNIAVSTLVGPPFCNLFRFAGNGWISDIFAANGIWRGFGTNTTEINGAYWPHPDYGTGTTGLMNAQVTQGVVEAARKFTNVEVRQTQGVVESVRNFSHPEVRMTQGVVEIILRKGGFGWQVYEA